jgi:hypothetical protein
VLVLDQVMLPPENHFDSKESLYKKRNQSLSVADLIHYDSVQVLNNKLEEKNHYLEE